MKVRYYDPIFYTSSAEMPFTIRVEMVMKERVREDALSRAVTRAAKRYPYFSLRIIRDGGEYLAVPNDAPLPVYPGPEVLPLGSDALDGHLTAVSYHENEICFYASHAVTDGGGFTPFMKTVLYEYLCEVRGCKQDAAGIIPSDSPLFPDELGNPFPEERMASAKPFYLPQEKDFFRLRDGGYVRDREKVYFRLRLPADEVMRCNHDNDGSPCILISSLMAKAVWAVHPELKQDLVSAVSFNLRPGLGNAHSYRMLCSALRLTYPERLRDAALSKLCTCSRGMVTLQSQPENVLYLAEQRRKLVQSLEQVPDLEEKKRLIGRRALEDSVANTFSVSYVGRFGPNSIEDSLEALYNTTDGSVHQSVFLEISAVGGWFFVSFQQGFSSDVYYRAFLDQLRQYGLPFREEGVRPLRTPELILP